MPAVGSTTSTKLVCSLVKSNIDRRGAQFGVVIASSNIENTKLVDSAFTQ